MKYIIPILFLICFGFGLKHAVDLYTDSKERSEMQADYAEINKVNYGLFNLQLWKEKALGIVKNRIGDFKISDDAFKNLEGQIDIYLRKMYKDFFESGQMLETVYKQIEESGKVNAFFMKMIKDNLGDILGNIDLESQIPGLTKQLSKEIKKSEPQIRAYVQEGLLKMVVDDVETKLVDKRAKIYEKYSLSTAEETLILLSEEVEEKDLKINATIKYVMGLLALGLLLLALSFKWISKKIIIVGFTLVSILLLLLGISLPMIDIDARLNSFSLDLLGEKIEFGEQVLLYQSKSILEVTQTLWEGRGVDLKLVGMLIFLFSIVFPFLKLLLSTLYLFVDKVKKSAIAKTIIFYLGKWSMADVFVVAMFMAYIGFHGLVTSQLGDIARNQTGYAVETLNYSRLAPGALFFTCYCILSIITSIMINRMDIDKEIA